MVTQYCFSNKLANDLGLWLFGAVPSFTVASAGQTACNGTFVAAAQPPADLLALMYPASVAYIGGGAFAINESVWCWRGTDGIWHFSSQTILGVFDDFIYNGTASEETPDLESWTAGPQGSSPMPTVTLPFTPDAQPTRPGSWTVHLLTAVASATSKGTEVSPGDYAAQTWTPAAGSGGLDPMIDATMIDFGIPAESWGTVVGVLIQDGNDTHRYAYCGLNPTVVCNASARVSIPIGTLIADWITVGGNSFNPCGAYDLMRQWAFGTPTVTRPTNWYVRLLQSGDELGPSLPIAGYHGYTRQPVNMVAKGSGYPGVFWNNALLPFGTPTENWTVDAYDLAPYGGDVSSSYGALFSNVYPAPITALNGADQYIAANALVVDLLNPPSS